MEPAASSTAPAELVSSLTALFTAVLAAYVFLLAPGQAWWHGRASSTPRLFARVALSALLTTVIGLGLAALETFSLPRLAVIGALVALFGYVFVARVRHQEPGTAAKSGFGPAVFVIVLCLYWPPYQTHIAASDSSTYVTAGVHLARSHRLWKWDPLVEELSPFKRRALFFSVMGYPWKPPYARMPGGLVIESPDSPIVRPSFFPAPIVWSALFADALGARCAGGFAALFSALAVWGFWHFARRRLDAAPASLATALVALNAASYWAGRFPLSEPLAWCFLWAGLVALDAYEEDGFAGDARLAGALLGGAGVARIEYLPFIAAALALRPLLRANVPSRPLTPGFALCFAALAAVALSQIVMLPGSYATPVADALRGLQFRLATTWARSPLMSALVAGVGVAACVWSVRRLGIVRTVAGALALAAVAPYVLSSHFNAFRSIRWLAEYLGPFALVMGAIGCALAWRRRHALSGEGFFVCLAVLVIGLLVYSPHVYPIMPWASRRYVPLVVPAIALWAVMALVRLRHRSFMAALVAGAVLVVTVAWPARATWRLPFYDGAYRQLQRVAEMLPADGTLLIDNRLISLLLSTPLWLAFDRNSVPVDTSTVTGRENTMAVVYSVADRGPVYLLKPSTAPEETVPLVVTKRVKDFEIELALPEQSQESPPQKLVDYVELVSLFVLQPWRLPPLPPAAGHVPAPAPTPRKTVPGASR